MGLKLAPDVLEHLRRNKISDLCYAVKIRTKSEAKLLEKKGRKRLEKPNYELRDITDVVGLRLVALFRADMIELLEGCLGAMLHTSAAGPSPFVKAHPKEIIFYKGNSAYDDMSANVRDIVKKMCGTGCSVEEKNSREGYSSLHIVGKLTHGAELESVLGLGFRMPIEIQIRTVFEDAWGEIDHKYGYVIRTGKHTGVPLRNPVSVLAHLKNLKRFTDACMEYGEAIRHDATRSETASSAVPAGVISVEADGEILDRFNALGIAPEQVDEFIEARRLKDLALNVEDGENKKVDRVKCLEAAEAFRDIADGIMNEVPVAETWSGGVRLLYYYARMNEALCAISVNDEEHIEKALTIYRNLEVKYPTFPLLRMRVGQALGKLGHFRDALVRLREAGEMTERVVAMVATAGWPDELPKRDYEHVIKTQPKLVGYYLWHQILACNPSDHEGRALLYKEAYDATAGGFVHVQNDEKQVSAYRNNLLYYSIGYAFHSGKVHSQCEWREGQVHTAIAEQLSYFEEDGRGLQERPIRQVETLMQAYSLTGKANEALAASVELKKRALDPATDVAPELAMRFLRSAERVALGQPLDLL